MVFGNKKHATDEELARDLDEIQRLVFMIPHLRPDAPYHEIAGTLINALVHHQEACTQAEARDVIPRACQGDAEAYEQLKVWAKLT